MALKTDLIADVQRRQQRLRELRDMTQDRDERIQLDEELDAMQVTLSDLQSMDETTLRRQRAEQQQRARRSSERLRAARVASAAFGLALLALFGTAVLGFRRRRRAHR